MKKAIILAAVAATAVTSLAHATAVCTGGTGASVAVTTTASMFVLVPFTAKCSANVLSNYSESANAFGVVAASTKGKNYFGGGTSGGGVRPIATCLTSGCSTTEVSDANALTQRDAS